jgi:hypothetical protein
VESNKRATTMKFTIMYDLGRGIYHKTKFSGSMKQAENHAQAYRLKKHLPAIKIILMRDHGKIETA